MFSRFNPPRINDTVTKCLETLLGEKVPGDERSLLEAIAELYLILGRTPEGLQCLQEAKNLHRQVFDWRGDARVCRKLGRLFHQRGEKNEATRIWQQAIHSAREADDRQGEVTAMDMLASSLKEEKRFKEAIVLFEESLDMREDESDQTGQGNTLMELGQAYASQGRPYDALRSYKQALRVWRAENERNQECECLQRICTAYLNLGRFYDLVHTGTEVLGLIDELNYQTGTYPVHMEMGAACCGLGLFEDSIRAFRSALEAARADENNVAMVHAMIALGRSLRLHKQHADAVKILKVAEQDSREGSSRHLTGDVLLEMGTTYWAMGQKPEAQKNLGDAAKFLKANKQVDRAAEAVLNLAAIAIQGASPLEAEGHMVRAHSLAQASNDPRLLATMYSARGSVLWDMGRKEDSVHWFSTGLDLLDDPTGTTSGRDDRLLGLMAEPFEGLIELTLKDGDPGKALEVAQRAHSYACLKQTEALVLPDKQATGSGPIERCERILSQIRGSYLRMQYTHDIDARKLLREHIHELRLELKKYQDKAEQPHPEYTVMRRMKLIQAADLQKTLDARTAVLMYFVGVDSLYLWVVTHLGVAPYVLPTPRKKLADLVRDFLNSLREAADADQVIACSQAVTQTILGEAGVILGGYERLLVVPDDVLYDVPFCALMSDEGAILSHHWDLAVIPSVPAWRVCRSRANQVSRNRDSRRMLAQSLVDSRDKVLRGRGLLASAGGDDSGVLTRDVEGEEEARILVEIGSEHTLEAFDNDIQNATMVHFSMPIDLSAVTPFSTEIHLADHTLSLQDLTLKTFSSDLVLFSATDTNLTERAAGEEWISFFMPLLYSGIPCAILTHWRVAEQARRQVTDAIFRHLQQGASNAQALRYAQMELMAQPEFSHPHFWAGFTMFGDGG